MKMMSRLAAALVLAAGVALAEDVPTEPTAINPILVGSKLPEISVKTGSGKTVSLNKVLKGKPAVLVYYRGGWCPFCNQQLMALGKKQAELEKLGFKIVAVSADRPARIKGAQTGKVTLYSDNTMAGAKALGIAFKVPAKTVKLYKEKYKIDIEADSGMTHHILPVPAVFVLDAEGTITFQYINPNYRVRLDDDVLIAAAKAVLK